ncbi:nucleotidyltransferase [Virgibacillus xinjiangensis]|uniref:tRNA(Met) cytidine acetate ligase n=1 Tax=Virgibacillus xinjiangensis TaxID=393090 RepID=A0ABV7CVA3_9BACI
MNACGLIVEYNPFHNGHLYHLKEAKRTSGSDCMIAVMSGNFLQRGEPAIMDKHYRAKAALLSGVDLVLELPYAFAVQSSDLFAKGSVFTLAQMGVSTICFGSESGDIHDFISSYHTFKQNERGFQQSLKSHLEQGVAYPEASRQAYQEIGLARQSMDLTQPNNILGFSYVKAILENGLEITPSTIKRTNSQYHDQSLSGEISSATSIRREILNSGLITDKATKTLPKETLNLLEEYRTATSAWHHWEKYFHLLHYKVMTMTTSQLSRIQGVDEGLEYRLKKTAKQAINMNEWLHAIKTKRYTWTRLQRMFTHLLTNTTKKDMEGIMGAASIPYVRLLGMSQAGQSYLSQVKKGLETPLITSLGGNAHPMLSMEEKAAYAYYSILPPKVRQEFQKQELSPPVRI